MRTAIRFAAVWCAMAATSAPALAGIEGGGQPSHLLLGMACCFLSTLVGPFTLCWLLSVVFRERPLEEEDRP